jgi:rhamnosyltransferase
MTDTETNTVSVVIPTFRPPTEVITTVSELSRAGFHILISDDASPVTFDPIFAELSRLPNVTVIRHAHNAGIARGLNDGLRWVTTPWLLTLDQDSRIPNDYISRAVNFLMSQPPNTTNIGACGAEIIQDRSGPITYPTKQTNGMITTEELIQSGTLWNVEALTNTGGFNEKLAMDAVDAASCLALRQHKYVIAVIPGLEFGHHLGNATRVTFMGRTIVQTNH